MRARQSPPFEPPPEPPQGATTNDATLTTSTRSPPRPELQEPAAASPWQRYEDLGLLGRGGMGEVHRVRDRILGRTLAMKLLLRSGPGAAGQRSGFLAEARLAAGLGHPGIVPVHDCGLTPEGALWFTMDEVRGETLRSSIRAAHAAPGGPSASARMRLAGVFLRICEAVAHAHRSGVVHRDLKPDNVMLGDLGEVLVVDWGLARALAAGGVRSGSVMGTPAYMPPEQARGLTDLVDRRSDVYALGAVLYEILCGAPPFQGAARAVLALVIAGPPEPVARRAPGALPEELVLVCERAMARDPDARFPDAGALSAEVRGFLDGVRRRERALSLVREAEALAPRVAERRTEARARRAEAAALLGQLETYDPADRKVRGWALEDEARALEVAAAVEQAALQTRLQAALSEAPELTEAHEALADLHAAELCAAEDARDQAAAARASLLLGLHDRGRHAALLDGAGAVSLRTHPAGAEVWAFRYVERARRLVEEPVGLLGHTPLRDAALPRGSYLLRVRAPGHVEMRVPVHLARGARFRAERPGGTDAEPWTLPLLREGELDPSEVYVPAGWFAAGGDPAAAESLPAQAIWVDGFVLDRAPVTVAAYLAFLNDLVAQGRDAEAEDACPRIPSSLAGTARVLVFPRDPTGRYQPPTPRDEDLLRPAVSMTWRAATAYAAWRATRTGQPWRLPSEIEREKAARGVDGRFLPWGNHPEPTWACMAGSGPGAPALATVERFPTDESPYGARGLAGNVRDWCCEAWTQVGPVLEAGALRVTPAGTDDPGLRSLRGGAYYGPAQLCRAAGRFAAPPGEGIAGVGLRLSRPFTGPATR